MREEKRMKRDEKEWSLPGNGWVSAVITAAVSLLAAVFLVFLLPVLVFHSLADAMELPSSQYVDGKALAEVFTSWYLPGFLFLCLLASLILIWIINWGRIRNGFLAVGISALLAGFFSVTTGLASRRVIGLLPGVYQSQLLGAADVYRDLAFAYSLVLTVIGVFFLSVYADIVILRRNKG